ncbi:MAG: sigma-70 family RNA polymerase sigma factor [Ruminococcaceae bacterium]|nr:sigma-70 family RNA polymerase sigma factor [Oscillospiraceae bacterium]
MLLWIVLSVKRVSRGEKMDNDQLTLYITKYGDMVFRVAYSYTKNRPDSQDIVQDTFLRLYRYEKPFDSEEHTKAWLIRTAVNLAKNNVRSVWVSRRAELDESLPAPQHSDSGLSAAMQKLDKKYSIVIYLYYFEGYSTAEIAKLLRLTDSNVKARLKRGRDKLRGFLSED